MHVCALHTVLCVSCKCVEILKLCVFQLMWEVKSCKASKWLKIRTQYQSVGQYFEKEQVLICPILTLPWLLYRQKPLIFTVLVYDAKCAVIGWKNTILYFTLVRFIQKKYKCSYMKEPSWNELKQKAHGQDDFSLVLCLCLDWQVRRSQEVLSKSCV